LFANLFKSEPLLDEESIQWLFDAFGWALRNLDPEVFRREVQLVLPTNAFFPGRENSVHGMANLIFQQVKGYAGMGHWPLELAADTVCGLEEATPQPMLSGAPWGSGGETVAESAVLPVYYDPELVGNPQGMIAGFAHTLAQHLGSVPEEEPPGGVENWPHLTEVLAVFMGFGLMFANSAYIFRGGCGSCSSRMTNRQGYLSQYHHTYALALFSVLKRIPEKEVSRHLKKSLRGFFRQAVKDVKGRDDLLRPLVDRLHESP
jgi:hypothetical protein